VCKEKYALSPDETKALTDRPVFLTSQSAALEKKNLVNLEEEEKKILLKDLTIVKIHPFKTLPNGTHKGR
jgi:hypothetical protein